MSTFYTVAKPVVARKDHRCVYCGETIAKGETYLFQSGYYDDWYTNRMHPECFDDLVRFRGDFAFWVVVDEMGAIGAPTSPSAYQQP